MDKTKLEHYASKILPECQVRKFRYAPELLAQELENEAKFPEVSNVLSDIYAAVKDKSLPKFLIAHRQLAGRISEETLCYSICHSIKTKTTPLTKREGQVLTLLLQEKSLLELF